MDVYCMPLEGPWPRPFTDPRRASGYGARWQTTLADLANEASKLGAKEVVIGLDVERSALRLDGWPRSDTNVPDHVAVYLPASDHGPLRFLSDRWWKWHDNVRAVALTLQRLRLVTEAGVAQGGEQYRGWQALPPGRAGITDGLPRDRKEAQRILLPWAAGPVGDPDCVTDWEPMFRRAVKELHPDTGSGDTAELARLTAARDLLKGEPARG